MTQLKNARHEAFARFLAQGLVPEEAFVNAGFKRVSLKSTTFNPEKLMERDDIRQRIQELQTEDEIISPEAPENNDYPDLSQNNISAERVMQELARVAFADIRQALQWRDEQVIEEDGKRKVLPACVTLKRSDDLNADIAAAISEVVQTSSGPKIKLHDKRAALIDLGKILGLFKQTSDDGAPRATITDIPFNEQEWAEHYVQN